MSSSSAAVWSRSSTERPKAEFDELMEEKIIPQVEDLIAPEVLEAAQEFVRQ